MSNVTDFPEDTFPEPGVVALFGSGETSPSGRKIFAHIMRGLPDSPIVAILETPAGFELNSAQVAERIAEYLQHHLQNFEPQIIQVSARKRETEFSPDNPIIAAPILEADLIFMGPGSPTYAVNQLRGSLTWDYLVARHRFGAGLAFASAATIAIGAFALPVYEIYKVGEDIHWKEGLDFFSAYGLSLVLIPHWNNNEGGEELDTSRCFVGQARFDSLLEMLPESAIVVGIDERTGLIIDLEKEICHLVGDGGVTVIRDGVEKFFPKLETIPIYELGNFIKPAPEVGFRLEVWERALKSQQRSLQTQSPPKELLVLVGAREEAREERNWEKADLIRARIEHLGWQVRDTHSGPKIDCIKV